MRWSTECYLRDRAGKRLHEREGIQEASNLFMEDAREYYKEKDEGPFEAYVRKAQRIFEVEKKSVLFGKRPTPNSRLQEEEFIGETLFQLIDAVDGTSMLNGLSADVVKRWLELRGVTHAAAKKAGVID